MTNVYKLSDNVIARIAQSLQECILLGVDVVDILRQIQVTPSKDGEFLELTPEYAASVESMHKKLLADLEEASKKQGTKLIFDQ